MDQTRGTLKFVKVVFTPALPSRRGAPLTPPLLRPPLHVRRRHHADNREGCGRPATCRRRGAAAPQYQPQGSLILLGHLSYGAGVTRPACTASIAPAKNFSS